MHCPIKINIEGIFNFKAFLRIRWIAPLAELGVTPTFPLFLAVRDSPDSNIEKSFSRQA